MRSGVPSECIVVDRSPVNSVDNVYNALLLLLRHVQGAQSPLPAHARARAESQAPTPSLATADSTSSLAVARAGDGVPVMATAPANAVQNTATQRDSEAPPDRTLPAGDAPLNPGAGDAVTTLAVISTDLHIPRTQFFCTELLGASKLLQESLRFVYIPVDTGAGDRKRQAAQVASVVRLRPISMISAHHLHLPVFPARLLPLHTPPPPRHPGP